MPCPRVAELVILAAGASSRMGHPKALTRLPARGEIRIDGSTDHDGSDPLRRSVDPNPPTETALERIVRQWREVSETTPIVVLGEHVDVVRAALPGLDVRWARNPRPDAGRTGSLQVALAGAREATVVVWPVDHPLATPATLRALLAARGDWIVPEHAGRGGHPIVLRSMAIFAVQSAPPDTPLRDVARAVGIDVTRVPVDDPGVLANLDRPGDVPR